MCGIVGIMAYGPGAPPVSRAELIRIRDSMERRGPDGAGEWMAEDQRVGLGHRRLAVIDLSAAGAQPMASADGETRITFNGEIYNYRELRQELEQQGHRFRTASDTEVLLHLYERHGSAMLPRLRGMFAFAIWDGRRRQMLLARDPLGIKPLYYADDGGTVRIASQVKALVAGGAVGTAASPAGCVSFFLLGYVAEPFTINRAVRALPAGHFLRIDAAGVQPAQPFFSIRDTFAEAEEARQGIAAEDRDELLRAALGDTVAAHMIADVPVGVFLSAGLDSSAITALASRSSGGHLHTMTLGFREYEGTEDDEVPLAREVATAFATEHRTTWVARDDFLRHAGAIFAAMDQPTTDGVNSYFVSATAAGAGLKVALSGLGGDELFGGYPGYRQIPRIAGLLGPLGHFPAFGRAFRVVTSQIVGQMISPKYAGLLEYGTSVEDAYLLRRALFMPWELPRILDPELVKAGWAELKPLISLRETITGLDGKRTRITALEMAWYMRNQLLRDADWAGMAHSVEVRTPFVDVELLRRIAPLLATLLPPTKQDMARATPVADLGGVIARPKTGFVVPVRQWFAESLGAAYRGRGLRGWSEYVFQKLLPDLAAAPA